MTAPVLCISLLIKLLVVLRSVFF